MNYYIIEDGKIWKGQALPVDEAIAEMQRLININVELELDHQVWLQEAN